MAAIVRKLSYILVATLLAGPVAADQASDVLDQIGSVANALSAGNPSVAMEPFDKSFPGYDKLRNELTALTASYKLQNEINVTDEQDLPNEANLTVNWVMTLENSQTNSTDQRTGDIKIRLVLKNRKWKIVGFSPTTLFYPNYNNSKSSS